MPGGGTEAHGDRGAAVLPWGVAALVVAGYLALMPRTVTLEDAGHFTACARHLGVAHPPGYPLHTVLGHAFTWLPLGSAAFRVALLSAVCGATAAGLLCAAALRLGAGAAGALLAGLLFAAAPAVVSQSTIVEVYSLNAALALGAFLAALRVAAGGGAGAAGALGLLCGLGLANHWPLFVLGSPAFLAPLLPEWRRAFAVARTWTPAFLAGLLPYAWLWIRSRQDPPLSFYGPIPDLERFWFFVSRQGYAGLEHSGSAAWSERLQFLAFYGRELKDWTIPGLALAAAGAWALATGGRRLLLAGFLAAALAGSALLALLVRVPHSYLMEAVFHPYPVLAWAWIALLAGLGLGAVARRLPLPARFVPAAALLLAALVVILPAHRAAAAGRRHDTYALDYARAVLDSVPTGTALFTHGDLEIGPLAYASLVEGWRPGVEVFCSSGLVFRNRLCPPSLGPGPERALREFARTSSRPVAYAPPFPNPCGEEQLGLVSLVRRDLPAQARAFSLPPAAEAFARRYGRPEPGEEGWLRYHRGQQRHRLAQALAPLVYSGARPEREAEWQPLLEDLGADFYGRLGMIIGLQSVAEGGLRALPRLGGGRSRTALLLAWCEEAKRLRRGDEPPADRGLPERLSAGIVRSAAAGRPDAPHHVVSPLP